MSQYLILFRSLTWAQSSQRLLERAGITSQVVKAPQELTTEGCGYALSLFRRFEDAVSILKRNNRINGRIYRREENGDYVRLQ